MRDSPLAGRFRISKEATVVLTIAVVGAATCAAVGSLSDVSLGDEVCHFYFAKRWVESGQRPITEPLIHASPRRQRRYMAVPLWHAGLAALWSLSGIRQTTAQLYQAVWYLLLVLAVYDCGRLLYDRRVGAWAAGLAASMPFAAAFTNMLYVDVPVVAFVALTLAFLLRRRFIIAAVLLGLAFTTKRNAYFLALGFFFAVLVLARGSWKRRLPWVAGFAIIVTIIHVPELAWRHTNLDGILYHSSGPAPVVATTGTGATAASTTETISYRFVHPSDIRYHPLSVVQYSGIPLLVGLALYAWRRPTDRRDWILAVPAALYMPLFFYFFWDFCSIRYLAPILPMLCLLSAKAICSIKSRRLLTLGVIGCALQFAAAETYMLHERKIPVPMREAYQWVRTHTEPDAGLMCLNTVLSPQTGRRAIWHSEASLPEIGYLLWGASEQDALKIFQANGIDYVFVEKYRVYDDRSDRYLPGYPQSFLNKLGAWESTRRVFENSAATTWKIAPVESNATPRTETH